MNSDGNNKPEPIDPDVALRMLDLELMRQRAARQQGGAPYRGLRAASFIFLIAIVLGALLVFYYVFYARGLDEFRPHNAPASSPTTAPVSAPP